MSDTYENKTIISWHQFVSSKDPSILQQLLAENVSFHSPVVHTPQQGKKLTAMYLMAATSIFNQSFRYVREIVDQHNACLEFMVDIDGIEINGVDIISWNEAGEITEFKVLIRPLKAINLIHQKMAEKLQAMPGREAVQ